MLSRILMIDDSLPLHKVVGHFVSAGGYEFASAFDGESGLAGAIQQPPSLIFLDMDMPGMKVAA